ncbi:hypothetical protein BTA51_09590 [Hahella sp. CCB-MM4]|uniref:hypothetical protein n=1 Tax=Hahella sp. (strain CCB-MM4) TaxID=1926491 RepID=UPI000B9AC49D|nr:hypothetical protein [Hahella sp. CCB-MM4]OZG74018.1 hypothetical protein BTA51_09590 [Hahella sp. CCB-MM4]
MTLLYKAEHISKVAPVTRTPGIALLTLFLGISLICTAEENLEIPDSLLPDLKPAEASFEMIFENGDGLDITFSEALINFIPEQEAANKTTMETITLAIMNNPEMAEIFVAGLFAPPAAGGPEYNKNQQAAEADREAAAYNPDRLARLETSIAATLLFGQLVEVQIVPDFRPPNFDNQTYNTTSRP